MKQRLLQFNHATSVVLCGCLVTCLSSCIDNEYDIDKGIDTEVKVLTGLTLPIGSLTPVYMSDLIEVDSIDMLEVVDGKYTLAMNDSTSMPFDLLKEGEELGFNFNPIVKSFVQPIADNTTFPSFPIRESKNIPIDSGLEKIEMRSVDTDFSMTTDLSLSFPDAIKDYADLAAYIAPTTLTGITLPVPNEISTKQVSIAPDMECPEGVTAISNIKFGANGNGVQVSMLLDMSRLAACFTNFQWSTPSITLTFPDGFKLANGSNVITFPSTTVLGGVHSVSAKLMSYDKRLVPVNNKMPAIGGEIKCEIGGAVTIITATTDRKALDLNSALPLSVACDAVAIDDVTISLADISVPIEAMELNQTIAIDDIPENIQSVEYVSFVQGTNALNLNLTKVQLPTGLSVTNSENVKIGFPKSLFDISGYDSSDASKYYMDIATNSLVGSGNISKRIYINKILLDGCAINSGVMSIDPGIALAETEIVVGGQLTLSDYNEFVEDYGSQNISVSVEAASLSVDEAKITTSDIRVELPAQDTTIVISEEIPSELEALYSIGFQSDVTATLGIGITGLPTGSDAGDIEFDNYTISFPKFLKFRDGEVDAENRLVIDETLGSKMDVKRQFNKVLHIESMDFSDPIYSDIITEVDDETNELNISIPIKMEGAVLLKSGSASTDIDEVTCDIRFELTPITVGRVSGKVSTDMLEVSEMVDMTDLTEEVDLGDATVTLSNPSIALSVINPLPIGLELTKLNLVPYKGGVALTPITTTETITVAAADIDDLVGMKSDIVLAAKPSALPGHYQVVGLERLLTDLPDSLMVDVKAGVVGDKHTIDLSRTSYSVDLKYGVSVPLEFENLAVSYTDTLTDLSLELDEMIEMPTVEMQLDIISTLPLTIDIAQLTPLDSMGNKLNLPDLFPADSKIKGSSDGQPVLSKFHIRLSDNVAGDLNRLDALLVSVGAYIDGSNGAVAFRPDQYLQIGLKVCLPDGVTGDVDELINGELEE